RQIQPAHAITSRAIRGEESGLRLPVEALRLFPGRALVEEPEQRRSVVGPQAEPERNLFRRESPLEEQDAVLALVAAAEDDSLLPDGPAPKKPFVLQVFVGPELERGFQGASQERVGIVLRKQHEV